MRGKLLSLWYNAQQKTDRCPILLETVTKPAILSYEVIRLPDKPLGIFDQTSSLGTTQKDLTYTFAYIDRRDESKQAETTFASQTRNSVDFWRPGILFPCKDQATKPVMVC